MKTTHIFEGWRMRTEICLESWWELRTIMLCKVAGCWGMLIMMAPTLKTAALLVFSPRWALYSACDLAMLHLTTVLKHRVNGAERQDWNLTWFFWCLFQVMWTFGWMWHQSGIAARTSNSGTPCRFNFLGRGKQSQQWHMFHYAWKVTICTMWQMNSRSLMQKIFSHSASRGK